MVVLLSPNQTAHLGIKPFVQHLYKVEWTMTHPDGGKSWGQVILTGEETINAFSPNVEWIPENAGEFIRKYGGTSAIPGKFIRYRSWLNLPLPGTGIDGDPNISIFLTLQIQDAVRDLVAWAKS